jgi:NADPH:quinone reductase-like Zn-dependent oxidoreductase
VPQKRAAPKPVNLGFEQAAAVPISAITALQGLRDKGRLQPGQRVMVIGAAGGVGSFAVQLAKAFGAHVTGVVSTTKTDLARSIGTDEVVDYTREDATDGRRRYDLVLDTAGNSPLSSLRRALTPKGTLVIVGGEAEGRWLGGTERLLRAGLLSPFVGQRLLWFVAGEGADDLQALTDLIEAGKVAPVIDRTYPLDQAPEALRYWAEGHARGKVVVTI